MSTPPPVPATPTLMERWKALLPTYGRVAITTYLAIFVVVFAGSVVAIRLGYRAESATGWLGTLGAAYAATKLSQPIRIGATLVLTPLLARFVRRASPP